jgi:quinol monooxygenase YgiN
MIHVIAEINVKEGHLPEFIDIFKSNVPAVRAEKGCIEYLPAVDTPTTLPIQNLAPDTVTVIEKWERLEDLQAHMNAPHMRAYQQKVKAMVAHVSVKVLTEA